jgi:tRNA pseudouridine55 synthase
MNDQMIYINKDKHWTSFDVVAKVRGLTKVKKVGHAGTLDPLATGVLILGLGKATKQLEQYQAMKKEYKTEIVLGGATKTDDSEFEPEDLKDVESLSLEEINACVQEKFMGTISQLPPQFSARKVKGKRAYELARRGEYADLKPTNTEIYGFEISNLRKEAGADLFPESTDEKLKQHSFWVFDATIKCSKGTYIRSLARDIGKELGTGGFLKSLVRTAIGNITLENTVTIAEFEKML